jgi:hypothetical protein
MPNSAPPIKRAHEMQRSIASRLHWQRGTASGMGPATFSPDKVGHPDCAPIRCLPNFGPSKWALSGPKIMCVRRAGLTCTRGVGRPPNWMVSVSPR